MACSSTIKAGKCKQMINNSQQMILEDLGSNEAHRVDFFYDASLAEEWIFLPLLLGRFEYR